MCCRTWRERNVYAITSFIFGLDNDTAGVAARTLAQMKHWPPVLPVFGQITPFPATPLYDRLAEGRPADAAEALAGVRAVPHGAHAAEDVDSRGAGRSARRVDERRIAPRRPKRASIRSRTSRRRTRSATSWRAFSSAAFTSRRRERGSGCG